MRASNWKIFGLQAILSRICELLKTLFQIFKTACFNHSHIPPREVYQQFSRIGKSKDSVTLETFAGTPRLRVSEKRLLEIELLELIHRLAPMLRGTGMPTGTQVSEETLATGTLF